MRREIDPKVIASSSTLAASWSPRQGGHDRIEVIIDVAEFEDRALQALIRFCASRNPSMTSDQAASAVAAAGYRNDVSLKRLANALHMVGLISIELRNDLRALYDIRVAYAHRAKAGLLNEEPELEKLIRDMECHKQNRTELEKLPSIRHVYRAIEAHLRTLLDELPQPACPAT